MTLIRRAAFDLTGLPPSLDEIDTFLSDERHDAYERLIDRYLASPHYGERWGRHWLDLAGYADSEGILDADAPRSAAWRYRDYVIGALNRDKPYDRFLQEQLAGDELVDYWGAYETQEELAPEVLEAVIATGFLRCASDAGRPEFAKTKMGPGYFYQTLDDTIKIVASSTMALTVECARCHDHKFDPIPQVDYYRLQAIFMSTYRPDHWIAQEQRRLSEATKNGTKREVKKADSRIAELRKGTDALRQEFAGYLFTGRLSKLPAQIRDDVRRALAIEPNKRTEVQKYLAAKFEKELRPDRQTLDRVLPEQFLTYKTRLKEVEDKVKAEKAQRGVGAEIRAAYDLPGEPKTYVLLRGEPAERGPEVQPGVPQALATAKSFEWKPPLKEAKTSGRRLAFARWLTEPNHPMTTRVLVNRLWLQHFGEGIVNTPDDLGQRGERPSHPELLDWLATELVRQGWSIKSTHRLMMLSSVYRQSSRVDPALHAEALEKDPENRLLWRQRLRRLEAETLRDATMSVAGTLRSEMYGPPAPVQRQPDGEVTATADRAGHRRSIYLQVRRSQPVSFLQLFDQPVMATNCTRRNNSTLASQALALLNGEFMTEQAEALAANIMKVKPANPAAYAFRAVLHRPPTSSESATAESFLAAQTGHHGGSATSRTQAAADSAQAGRKALVDLCQMLLSCNEFFYID